MDPGSVGNGFGVSESVNSRSFGILGGFGVPVVRKSAGDGSEHTAVGAWDLGSWFWDLGSGERDPGSAI